MTEMGSTPGNWTFSLAYNVQDQYTGKDCHTDLVLGMPSLSLHTNRIEGYRPPATMSLLPGADVSVDYHDEEDESTSRSVDLLLPHHVRFGLSAFPAISNSKVERAQLTIFFGGKVVVSDDFPTDKAMLLMQLASKSSKKLSLIAPSSSVSAPDLVSCPSASNPLATVQPRLEPNFSVIPITRKASLHRFLEKRKDRISAKAPYQVSNGDGSMGTGVTMKQEEITGSKSFLGLGPQMSEAGRNCYYIR
ncbi:hypothetical protein HPP92_009416 [Vanilla planifolia]|uniref:Protein TIFY n=1 Tax=Vanilla planifolia TaxID=51239 RepID=A0A835RG57_VANPL|nr:hypothetical protein HPP92_009416 [Vanilla planifolia]